MQGIPRKIVDLLRDGKERTAVEIREALDLKSAKADSTLGVLKAQMQVQSERRESDNKIVYKLTEMAANGEKDRSKIMFNKEMYSKPKFVHAFVAAFVDENNPDMKELQAAFPDDLHPAYPTVMDVNELEEKVAKRFYTRENQVIELRDGTKVAVCSDWGVNNMYKFMEFLREQKNYGFSYRRITDQEKIKQIQDDRRREKAKERARTIREAKKEAEAEQAAATEAAAE